jgi:hypothetical protein
MNKTLGIALVVVAVLAVAGGLFFSGMMFGGHFGFGPANMMYGRGYGMMGGGGARGSTGYGPGMMNRGTGYGMMNGGNGMMGGYAGGQANAIPLTVEQARASAQKYLTALGNPDLAIAEVMIFSDNAYVAVKETSTGTGAFELLVDPSTLGAYPEHGPNMMWNVKYGGLNHSFMMGSTGMMGGMLGRSQWNKVPSGGAAAPLTVTPEQAVQYAQKYLDTSVNGAVAAKDPMAFYGYYTLDYSQGGRVAGMLSVNGYTGQVFLHTWHGSFIEEAE